MIGFVCKRNISVVYASVYIATSGGRAENWLLFNYICRIINASENSHSWVTDLCFFFSIQFRRLEEHDFARKQGPTNCFCSVNLARNGNKRDVWSFIHLSYPFVFLVSGHAVSIEVLIKISLRRTLTETVTFFSWQP